MTFSTEELLFAAHVREAAMSLRKQGAPSPSDLGPDWQEELNAWFGANPLSSYIPETLARITQVAEQIRDIKESQQQG